MRKIYFVLLVAFILRGAAAIYFIDPSNDYYWEYGEIAKNIVNGNGYSLFYAENSKVEHRYRENVQPSVSAFMPPGYVYTLVPFILISNPVIRNGGILLLHVVISVISIYLLFMLTTKMFGETAGLIASVIAAVLPEFIYANLSFTPAVIYHFLVILLLYLYFAKPDKTATYIICAFIIAITTYFRSEFLLFGIFLVIQLILKKEIKKSLYTLFIIIIMLLPWSVRNYYAFNEFIPLSTSYGLNLYRGNNPEKIGYWGDKEIFEKMGKLKGGNTLETELSKIYSDKAYEFIKENPGQVFKNVFVKLYSFLVYNNEDKRAGNLFLLVPSLIILILFLFGLIKTFNIKNYEIFYLFFIFSIITIIVFFPLPRYSTMMKIALVPFCAYTVNWFQVKIINFTNSD